jgi:RNA polymerase sigma-70 factor (ECF subfamily)
MMVLESDEAAFGRVRAGDREALVVLVERYQRRGFIAALRLLGNRADAEDAVQQAFLRLYQSRAAYNPRWRFSTWFYRILTNACIDWLRRARPMAALDGLEFSTTDTPERALLRREQTALLQTALAAVPVEARMALTLHYGEIGAIRGISVNTVKTHLRRGRAALRKALRARLMERS